MEYSIFGKVPDHWTQCKIGDVVNLRQGLQISTKYRVSEKIEGYIPLLKIMDLPKMKFSEYVTDIKNQYIAVKDDIIYTRTGQVGLVYTDIEGCVHNNCFKVEYDPNTLDKMFLFYYLNNKFFKQLANNVASGSVQKDLTHTSFNVLSFAFPGISMQKKISSILFSLEEKINLNATIISNLEQLTKTLFKRWFVDFEFPNEDGESYKSNGGVMVENDLGLIPDGWEATNLGNITRQAGHTVKINDLNEVCPYIGLEHMPRGSIALSTWETSEKISSNKTSFKKGDILFGKLRPYFKKVGIAPINGICSTDILVINVKELDYYSFLMCVVSQDAFIDYCSATATGTRMPRTGWGQITKFKIVVPPNEIARLFNTTISPFYERIMSLIHENNSLQLLQDTLLPKLLSGELEIPEENEVKADVPVS